MRERERERARERERERERERARDRESERENAFISAKISPYLAHQLFINSCDPLYLEIQTMRSFRIVPSFLCKIVNKGLYSWGI